MIFVVLSAVGFLLGVLVRGLWNVPAWGIWAIVGVVAVMFVKGLGGERSWLGRNGKYCSMVLLCFLLGVFRVSYYLDSAPKVWPSGMTTATGQVAGQVDKREDNQKITVKTTSGRLTGTF